MIESLTAKLIFAIDLLKSEKESVGYLWQDDFSEQAKTGQLQSLVESTAALEAFSRELHLVESLGRCERFRKSLQAFAAHRDGPWSMMPSMTADEMRSEISGIVAAFSKELKMRKFAFIPPGKVEFFEQDQAFGKAVYDRFENARLEIKDAANCLAADLPTAAVFHLMRIVETGLRELARSLKVKIKKTPLDYAGWDSVVRQIDEKLTAKIPKARGPRKTKSLQFKHNLLADFKAFEVERNEVMHARRQYNQSEAHGIYLRVRDFMQLLTTRMSE